MLQLADLKIAIIGLGYVGLPLAVEFGKKVPVVGFDIHQARITELLSGKDHTSEVSTDELAQANHLTYSCLLYTSPSPRDKRQSRMPSSA